MEGFDDQNVSNVPENPVNTGNQAVPEVPASPADSTPDMGSAPATDNTAFTQQGDTSGAPAASPSPIFGGGDGHSEYMNPVFMQAPPVNEPPRKKFKALPLILGIAAVFVIGIVVVLVLMRDVIANSMAKSSKTPEEYMRYVVEKQPWNKMNEGYDEVFKQVSDMDNMKVEGEIRLNMSEDMLEVAEGAIEDAIIDSRSYYYYSLGDDFDLRLDAWQDIALKFETQRSDSGFSAMQAVQLKDKDYLLSLEEMYDAGKSTAYLRSPQLNEDYACVKLSNFLKEDELDMINQLFGSNKNVYAALPDSKTMNKMRERYINAMLDQIEDVEMEDDTMEIDGQSMKCTVLTFELDEDLQKSMLEAMISELKNDDDLEDMFYNILKETPGTTDMDPDEIWDQFVAELEKAEDQIDDYKASVEPDISLYVDNKGNIVGFKASQSKDAVLAGYIRKGNKLWVELSAVSGKKKPLTITGEGKIGVSGLNMDCLVALHDDDDDFEVPFYLENVGVNGGTFRMDMEPFCDTIRDSVKDDTVEDILDMIDGELVITSQYKDLESKCSMAIENKGETQLGISYLVKISKGDDIEFPANKQTVKVNSALEVMPYLGDCDIEKLADALEKLGLPEEYADEVRDSADMLKYY